MNNFTIRKARPNDSNFAYSVKKAAFKEYVNKIYGWDDKEQRKLHEQRFRTQDFRVINIDGTDIGIIAVVIEPDCMKLNQFLLLPAYQGRNIGHQCMSLIMEEAHFLSLPVRLRVMKANPRALSFYQSLGFMRSGETETHDLMEFSAPDARTSRQWPSCSKRLASTLANLFFFLLNC